MLQIPALCTHWTVVFSSQVPSQAPLCDLQTSNQVLSVLLKSDKAEAATLTTELQDMRTILEQEGDADSSRFLKVLQVRSLPYHHSDVEAAVSPIGHLCAQIIYAAPLRHAVGWQGMLQHTLLEEADQLHGMYAQALNRIYNQVRASIEQRGIVFLLARPSSQMLACCRSHAGLLLDVCATRFPICTTGPGTCIASIEDRGAEDGQDMAGSSFLAHGIVST